VIVSGGSNEMDELDVQGAIGGLLSLMVGAPLD
jgi:hypothetical protein